jgi:hypothetical protein
MLLVANFSRPMPSLLHGADPANAAPTKTRTGFEFGHVQNIGMSATLTQHGYSASVVAQTTNVGIEPFENTPPTRPTGVVTVANNTFAPGSASLFVGPFELAANRDFIAGGGVNATATAIAAAIDNLPGYDAAAVAADITVTGPLGVAPASLAFSATYRTSTRNFTFTYTGATGYLGYTDSPLVVEILPAGVPNGAAPP